MNFQVLSDFSVSDTTIRYVIDDKTGRVGLQLLPTLLLNTISERRETLRGLPEIDSIPASIPPDAYSIDPLVHVKLVGDDYTGGFAQGHTMRNSPSVDSFRYFGQEVSHSGDKTSVSTILKSPDGYVINHELSWFEGDSAAKVVTSFHNGSNLPVTLEMLSSFSSGGITPFDSSDASEKLQVHRFRSAWSAEGRLVTETVEQLHLERSWSGAGAFSERFGQVGSMPVRRWFPFVAVEDTVAGVLWGAQLEWAGSWQLEIFRQDDTLAVSGGLADREFGHWTKTLAPGERLTSPTAVIACVHGDFDNLCDRMTALQNRAADNQPEVEHDLPIIFNEWCMTWGDPSHEKVLEIARKLNGTPVKYLVIDAGWYKGDSGDWNSSHGDWIPSETLFPDGLEATVAAIRAEGLIPGLWFEMETVGRNSSAFFLVDHLLKRDGHPITVRERRFWDMNDPFVVEYLTEKVIDLLKRCGFGYLKVDYNETIGIGSDGLDSQGEGLRQQILGVYAFFDRIRERLPNLVIENCSSGGHRLEPSMLGRTAMSSFSDAHELVEIPIIAANLHRLILPRQSQIWAVLHPGDTHRRLVYSLAATFLGRMCLSGDITGLDDSQWELTLQAQKLYRKAYPIIKHGTSRRYGHIGPGWRHPKGWQGVVRISPDKTYILAVLHAFSNAPTSIEIPLPEGMEWQIKEILATEACEINIKGDSLTWLPDADFSAAVVLLSRV